VVAIDGAAGSGKSTLARGLARELQIPYVNTGLMYRALAAAALRRGIAPDDAPALVEVMGSLRFRFTGDDPTVCEVEGMADDELTSPGVERTVSAVARHPEIRRAMRDAQRSIGLASGAVMEGRDIASVVFPDAPLKLYLTAEPGARAARRAEERAPDIAVAEDLRARDEADARTNPHEPADGADVIDTGTLSISGTLDEALRLVRLHAPWMLREGSE
jgi:cytidylate kinase